jgi:hypothetical protein
MVYLKVKKEERRGLQVLVPNKLQLNLQLMIIISKLIAKPTITPLKHLS